MCGLTFPCHRALCGPRIPPYVPETVQKGPQKPQILCRLAGNSHKPRTSHIFGYMAQNAIPRAPNPPAIPHFLWFPPLRIAYMDAYTPVPRPGRLRQAASSNRKRWVRKWVNTDQWGKKLTFLKNDPRPCVMLKQVFLDCFELVVAHFGPPKIPKCLENGLFWYQKWVKNGSKTHFSKNHPRPFGVHQRVK